jgi:two-component system, OmpR family, response regulator ChvI
LSVSATLVRRLPASFLFMTVVAIVHDEFTILTSLGMALEAEGFAVDTYSDPTPALLKLILVPPSILILNGRMPGMHGIEFFLRFREFARAPVIFLSVSAEEIEDYLNSIGKPAEGYIAAFSQRRVIDAINDVLRF